MTTTTTSLASKQEAVIEDLNKSVRALYEMYEVTRERLVSASAAIYSEHSGVPEADEVGLILANGGSLFLDAVEKAFIEGAVLTAMWDGSLGWDADADPTNPLRQDEDEDEDGRPV